MIELLLPYPPSINKAYRNVPGKGRVKSRAYLKWLDEASIVAKQQHPNSRIGGPFTCQIIAQKPDNRKRDIDNLIKVTLDCLCAEGFIDDDSRCQKVSAEWGLKRPGILVKLEAA